MGYIKKINKQALKIMIILVLMQNLEQVALYFTHVQFFTNHGFNKKNYRNILILNYL